MADPRNHHYLPQCYLRGFANCDDASTKADGEKAQVYVRDVKDDRWFRTNVRNVGASRDFNRVETEGFTAGALESKLAIEFEGPTATMLQRMRQTREMPDAEGFNLLMNLVAALAIRNPSVRKELHRWQAQTAEIIMSIALASKERWETTLRQMREAGHIDSSDVTYEQMKDFHERGNYTFGVAQSRYFRLETAGMDAILPTLARRKWTLFVAEGANGRHFVTCDRPAMLVWADGARGGPVGHALKGTALLFPVSQELALLGLFDGHSRVVECDDGRVARFNRFTLGFADRQVYSPRPRFMVEQDAQMKGRK